MKMNIMMMRMMTNEKRRFVSIRVCKLKEELHIL